MRNINDLHPTLQEKIVELKRLVKTELKIDIGIAECLRTKAEQDALYAKGRTTPGSIVTNCKGSSYSSMHQWGVAFDFYLIADVDGDGQTADDAYNNQTRLFNKVGAIGQRIGLEWGGSWKSIVDLPHFQLPNWGSTASKLKNTYKTPEKFFESWSREKLASLAGTTYKNTDTSRASFKKLVMELQQAFNQEYETKLAVDGIAGVKTYGATPMLNKKLSKNKPLTTAALQALLNWHSCSCGKVDGKWGSNTDAAIKKFQIEIVGLPKAYYEFPAKGKSWKKILNL